MNTAAIADVASDGIADLVLRHSDGIAVIPQTTLYGVQNALPGAPVTLPFQATQPQRFAGPIAIGDVNCDGRGDIVTAD